ncbi:hypothetical protein ACNFJ7_02015 [Sphingomonas sp. HT-1]|uniref:hypothetical protein n=1 Tax=unclassified Sphingomonas TaxID=196159 RepID=UPI0002EC3FBB|nr:MULTISPECIES: hypothetical protein [unclassified Sphingomonas]KTF68647.1 hypothetical protein ATB93_13050 [Sphingomonas sp. WG]
MGAAEKLDGTIPFWPAAMTRAMALAYTSVSETQMRQWEREGTVRFRARGPNGSMITERAQLDDAIRKLFGDVAEDMDFGDGD